MPTSTLLKFQTHDVISIVQKKMDSIRNLYSIGLDQFQSKQLDETLIILSRVVEYLKDEDYLAARISMRLANKLYAEFLEHGVCATDMCFFK